MSVLEKNISVIEELLKQKRNSLENLIQKKQGNLLDPDVVASSQDLDIVINKYNEFIEKNYISINIHFISHLR